MIALKDELSSVTLDLEQYQQYHESMKLHRKRHQQDQDNLSQEIAKLGQLSGAIFLFNYKLS